MYLITTMMVVLVAALAAKKNPVFGQMTLTGEKALDWLKTADAEGKEGVTYKVTKVRMVLAETLTYEGWNVPDWKEGRTWTALCFLAEPEYANPIWIHQRSAVQGIESLCAGWEEAGATINPKTHEVDFGDKPVALTFKRGKGTYARYEVKEN